MRNLETRAKLSYYFAFGSCRPTDKETSCCSLKLSMSAIVKRIQTELVSAPSTSWKRKSHDATRRIKQRNLRERVGEGEFREGTEPSRLWFPLQCSKSSERLFKVSVGVQRSRASSRVQSTDTKIDFILFRKKYEFWRDEMICECKRANPAISNWCFIRAPFVHRNYGNADPLVTECLILPDSGPLRAYARTESQLRDGYHIARGINAQQKGDERPAERSRSQIEDAISQVLRGLNGYVEMLAANPQLMQIAGQDSIFRLIPVVFTTAKLWVSDRNLSDADLDTGKIDLDKGAFRKVPWLWFQYNVSIGIKHSRTPVEKKSKIEELLAEEHIRSIDSKPKRDFGFFD